MTTITIGQLARQVGVNIETIRYYEREGLMMAPKRTANGRRAYGDESIKRLAFIRKARELDFSLDDTRALLTIRDREGACEDAKVIAARHLQHVRVKMAKAIEAEQLLTAALRQCAGGTARACTVLSLLETSSANGGWETMEAGR
jgi:MerR family mercuric resistance operon transcriptional regulator